MPGENLYQSYGFYQMPLGCGFWVYKWHAHHPYDWGKVLNELETKYKFRHLDVWTGERGDEWPNLMIFKDTKGRIRPIMIDLEDYELL
jgi:hypothetical protein